MHVPCSSPVPPSGLPGLRQPSSRRRAAAHAVTAAASFPAASLQPHLAAVAGRPAPFPPQRPAPRSPCFPHRWWRGAGPADRKSVVSGKRVAEREDLGGRRLIKKK